MFDEKFLERHSEHPEVIKYQEWYKSAVARGLTGGNIWFGDEALASDEGMLKAVKEMNDVQDEHDAGRQMPIRFDDGKYAIFNDGNTIPDIRTIKERLDEYDHKWLLETHLIDYIGKLEDRIRELNKDPLA